MNMDGFVVENPIEKWDDLGVPHSRKPPWIIPPFLSFLSFLWSQSAEKIIHRNGHPSISIHRARLGAGLRPRLRGLWGKGKLGDLAGKRWGKGLGKGKGWENVRERMWRWWEDDGKWGKIVGTCWENDGNMWRRFWENHGENGSEMMGILGQPGLQVL